VEFEAAAVEERWWNWSGGGEDSSQLTKAVRCISSS